MRKQLLSLLVAGALVLADQAIKHWATASLQPVGARPLLPGVVELRYLLNDGMAFSMLSGKQTLLITATSIILLGVAGWLLFGRPTALERAAWVLVLGGGAGNLVDRALNGQVVDYINLLFMDFAVFNFADICVCTGVGLLILGVLLEMRRDGAVSSPGEGQNDAEA